MKYVRRFYRVYATFLTIFVITVRALANESTCEREILFLPQAHGIDKNIEDSAFAQLSNKDYFKIADSQLRILNFLKKNPDIAVFSEMKIDPLIKNISKKKKLGTLSDEHYALILGLLGIGESEINNFPTYSTHLSANQKHALIEYGAVKIALLNGTILNTFNTIKEEDTDRVFTPVYDFANSEAAKTATAYPPLIARLIYETRERLALEEINNYWNENKDQKRVILVYGANHNFQFYNDLFPADCIVVPNEFRPYWKGSKRTGPLGF